MPGTPEGYLYGLAGVVVLGFFALTVTMILTAIPKDSRIFAYMLLGGLVTGFSMVLSYLFWVQRRQCPENSAPGRADKAGDAKGIKHSGGGLGACGAPEQVGDGGGRPGTRTAAVSGP